MAITTTPLWTFRDPVAPERREELACYTSFDSIIAGLVLMSTVSVAHWAPFADTRLRGCGRAEFLLKVPVFLYDAFFNSPVGYRAQYAMGAQLGQRKNRELIDALADQLAASFPPAAREIPIRVSLSATAAKIWIHEAEVATHFHDDEPEIDYAPWRRHSEMGPGLRAPLGTELIVYGGWIDIAGRERLDPYKLRRSEEIHEVGFS